MSKTCALCGQALMDDEQHSAEHCFEVAVAESSKYIDLFQHSEDQLTAAQARIAELEFELEMREGQVDGCAIRIADLERALQKATNSGPAAEGA